MSFTANNSRRKRDIDQLKNQNEKIKTQRDQILAQSIKLEQQDDRLKLAQTAARLGGWEYNVAEDRLVWYDETIDIFTNYRRKIPTPEEFIESIHPDDRDLFLGHQSVLIKQQIPYEEILRHKNHEGKYIYVRLIARPVIEGNKVIRTIGVLQDITEIIDYQKKLEKLNFDKDLIQAAVAHDLRSPLNNILSLSSILADQLDETGADKAVLQMIEDSAERGQRLIDDLLESNELQDDNLSLNIEATNVSDLLTEIFTNIKKTEKDTRLDLAIEDDEIIAQLDRSRFSRAIDNLINNARKFTPTDGEILVRMAKSDSHLTIAIKDSGIGIPADLQPILFDRFSKAKRRGLNGEKPHGLGMSIVKTIIDLHQGTIDVDSEVDLGTTFSLTLPIFK